jgi:hypothetical protein
VRAAPNPYTLATWFTSPSQDLHGSTPAQWLADDRGDEPLRTAARRLIGRLSH